MATPVYNPWNLYVGQFSTGLDYIAANIASPTFDSIRDTTMDYYATLSPSPGGGVENSLERSIATSANDYIDLKILENLIASPQQLALIESLYMGIMDNSIESLENYFDIADDQISMSSISNSDKAPIWAALAIARASLNYWESTVATPGNWSTYLDSDTAANYANIPNWILASFVGVLSGYSKAAMMKIYWTGVVSTESTRLGIEVGVGVAISLTSGKVILDWSKRP